jgi:calcineurin-like phosphoesterase family protein
MNQEELIEYYIQDLKSQVSFNGGATYQLKVRHPGNWVRLQATITSATMVPNGTDVWIWSDLHFGHTNVIKYSHRPFKDVVEMNSTLVKNFNSVVQSTDISFWVGDIGFGNDVEINHLINQCNGYKVLIVGNHDLNKGKLRHLNFNEIHIVYKMQYAGRDLVCSHYPLESAPVNFINIHGHIHASNPVVKDHVNLSDHHINVNCEFHNYHPIKLSSLL